MITPECWGQPKLAPHFRDLSQCLFFARKVLAVGTRASESFSLPNAGMIPKPHGSMKPMNRELHILDILPVRPHLAFGSGRVMHMLSHGHNALRVQRQPVSVSELAEARAVSRSWVDTHWVIQDPTAFRKQVVCLMLWWAARTAVRSNHAG